MADDNFISPKMLTEEINPCQDSDVKEIQAIHSCKHHLYFSNHQKQNCNLKKGRKECKRKYPEWYIGDNAMFALCLLP